MRVRIKRRDRSLKSVVVNVGEMEHIGLLLFETTEFIVLINNVVTGADVGPLRPIRTEQIEPECDVLVLPRAPGMTVKFLKSWAGCAAG
jgi:hypothetical protein